MKVLSICFTDNRDSIPYLYTGKNSCWGRDRYVPFNTIDRYSGMGAYWNSDWYRDSTGRYGVPPYGGTEKEDLR